MFPKATQTAGMIGLKYFVDTHGFPGSVIGKKHSKFFCKIFFPWATPGPSVPNLPVYKCHILVPIQINSKTK